MIPPRFQFWQIILSKYPPAFIGKCENSIKWASEIAEKSLKSGMFLNDRNGKKKAKQIAKELTDHGKTKSHSRHLSLKDCENLGLKIIRMEDMTDDLQDTILTVHHTYMHTFSQTNCAKIVENHLGYAMVLRGNPPQS